MFTGLIEEVGRVAGVARLPSGKGLRLAIEAGILGEPMPLGASLAVDGVCLTVVAARTGRVEVEVGPESLERTTLDGLGTGTPVNLERALRVGDRLGGHLVQGHVDGVGRVVSSAARGEAWDVRVAMPPELCRYVIEKGSICVDGISLTVNRLEPDGFWVSLVPHSQSLTTLARRAPGEPVNLEVDLVGKYVERLLGPREPQSGLTLDALKENGFV
jgi:riboflavin synthase